MNWSRAKTILIILFAAVNLVLLVSIILTTNLATSVGTQTINDTIDILKKNGIEIKPELIARKIDHMPIAEVQNITSDKEAFAKSILGNELAAESEDIFVKGTKKVVYHKDYFEYLNEAPTDVLGNDNEMIAYTDKFLNDIGLPSDNRMMISKEYNYQGDRILSYMQYIQDKPLFESFIMVRISEVGIHEMRGRYMTKSASTTIENVKTPLRHITGILIDLINNANSSQKGDIISIEIGYTVSSGGEDFSHRVLPAFPAYRITFSDGAKYVYDAVAGKYVK